MALGAGLAIDAMRQGRWLAARQLWQACLIHEQSLTADDYNACARVHERLADWNAHRNIVHQGLLRFPHDAPLQQRDLLCQAMDCLAQHELGRAEGFLASAGQMKPVSDWPCAFGFWSAHVLLRQRLRGLSDRLERLRVISDLALYRESHLMPRRMAGLMESVECMTWSEADSQAFAQRLEPLGAAISSYDTALSHIGEDQELEEEIARFAHFCQGYMRHLAELPAGYCEFLARLFIGYGHVELYLYLRQIFVQKIEDLTCSDNILPLVYQVAWANENGDYQTYTRLKKLKGEMVWSSQGKKKINHYFGLSALCYVQESGSLPFSEADEHFHRYVRGKRVAIVGPVDVGLDSGAEIDGFDIVVRFNHRQGMGYEAQGFGSKTEVSYYVAILLKSSSPVQEVLHGMEELDYAVLNRLSLHECGWLDAIPCRKRVGLYCLPYLSTPLVIGYPHAVQRALMDLLRFGPAQVKVFSADLYTGMRYRQEYSRGLMLGLNGWNVMRMFTLHDPVSNFLFMQRLWRSGRIEVDDVLASVLAMRVPEYMEQVRLCHVGSGVA